jgi:hypothetical protein
MSEPERQTVQRGIDKCKRRKELTLYIGGGGLGGLALFGAGDLAGQFFQHVPGEVTAIFVTSALVSGLCLAFAYAGFEYEATLLERRIQDKEIAATDSLPTTWRLPRPAEHLYKAATILVVVTGVWLLVAVWWAGIAPS